MLLPSWEMGGLSGESGANFRKFTLRPVLGDHDVTNFLDGGSFPKFC